VVDLMSALRASLEAKGKAAPKPSGREDKPKSSSGAKSPASHSHSRTRKKAS